MIIRVFTFSYRMKKKLYPLHHKVLSIGGLFSIIVISMIICSTFTLMIMQILGIFFLMCFLLLAIPIGFSLSRGPIGAAYALNENGELFRILKDNTGAGLTATGFIAGSFVDEALSNSGIISSSLGSSIGTLAGSMAQYSITKKNMEFMLNRDKIASIFTRNDNFNGFHVLKLIKCHSIVESKYKYVIMCDYYDFKKKKFLYNKNIKIYKVYNSYLDLINIINNLKYN